MGIGGRTTQLMSDATAAAAILRAVALTDCFGIGLTLTVIGVLAVALEYSPLARSKFFRRVYFDAPGSDAAGRRRSSLILSWCVLFVGHAVLAVGAVWWLTSE